MRGLPPAAEAFTAADLLATAAPPACEEEMHIGVPSLCDLLPPPGWLSRYERLAEARPDDVDQRRTGDWATGDLEDKRAKELAQTHSLIEAGWRADVARGELTQERMNQLVTQLRAEAAVAASVDDSERVRCHTVLITSSGAYSPRDAECAQQARTLQMQLLTRLCPAATSWDSGRKL